MIRFDSDYLEGAHPEILAALTSTNPEQTSGYGEDPYCEEARSIIRRLCEAPQAEVQFLVGGTQTNRTVIASQLRPHQGVVCAGTGHIAVHETGAVENAGHKVLPLPAVEGKLTAEALDALCAAHYADEAFEHTVQPGMAYISNSTEIGTVYTRGELAALRAVCRKWNMPLYIDGARLGCALVAEGCDYTLADMAGLCDIFTIGGTKLGMLFGEAVVFTDPALSRDFRYLIKQNGGMLAKGRLLGVQFCAALRDGLYWRIARQETTLALRLRDAVRAKGWSFLTDSPTNQQFPVLPADTVNALRKDFGFSTWGDMGGMVCVRFCTSWATTVEQVDALIRAIPEKV